MLLWRAKEVLEGGSELLKAEAELAGMRLRRMLVGSLIACLFGVLALMGLFVLIAGGATILAQAVGWGISLLIVGGSLMLSAAVGWLIYSNTGQDTESITTSSDNPVDDQPPEEAKEDAKERMSDAIHDEHPGKSASPFDRIDEIKDEAIDYAIRNPTVVGGAALLAVSLIGPGRSLRTISKVIATAGLVQSAINAISESSNTEHESGDEDPQRGAYQRSANGVRR